MTSARPAAGSPGGELPADGAALSVAAYAGLAAIERHAGDIDRLNAASVRPSPFNSSAFLRLYGLRIEYFTPGREERLFVIRRGADVIGIAAMRRSRETLGAGPVRAKGVRLQFLAPLDTESPAVLCAPEDEAQVAAALLRHLCEREPRWGLLEFAGQRPGSPLHTAVHAASTGWFRARDITVNPYNEIPLAWPNLAAYFRSLAKKMRSNISRQARRLFAAGEPELVIATGATAVGAWFDAYCDLERRSWKSGTPAAIERHPRRVQFYRELAAGHGGFDPQFIGIVLDGVLIAGLLMGSDASGSGSHGAWCLEMSYDRTKADLGPGQLLLLLAVGHSIECGRQFLNFMQNFAYYKHRWAARPIDVVNLQLIRRASLHDLSAWVGDFKRRRSGSLVVADTADDADAADTADPLQFSQTDPRLADLSRARLLTMAAIGLPGTRRLDRATARAHLPFDLE